MTGQKPVSVGKYIGLFALVYSTLSTLILLFPSFELGVDIGMNTFFLCLSGLGVNSVFTTRHDRGFYSGEYWKLLIGSIVVAALWVIILLALLGKDLPPQKFVVGWVFGTLVAAGILSICYSGALAKYVRGRVGAS